MTWLDKINAIRQFLENNGDRLHPWVRDNLKAIHLRPQWVIDRVYTTYIGGAYDLRGSDVQTV
jgi:hypothetical protein